ncbi:MAG: 4-alpha-glucanotransferase [Chitinophagaceae bacterium]|nr:4-alpha-glucanotransferase [Chitinophagaceae bacterium]
MKIQFYLRYHTEVGQSLWISQTGHLAGDASPANVFSMTFLNQDFWQAELELSLKPKESFAYKYFLKNKDDEIVEEWGHDRIIDPCKSPVMETIVIDTWNYAGEFENVFFTAPYQSSLLKVHSSKTKTKAPDHVTHIFKIKAPLLQKNEVACITGSGITLGQWSTTHPLTMIKDGNWWVARIDLSADPLPVTYKYGIYNTKEEKFVRFEEGADRFLIAGAETNKTVILHDGFIHLPNNTWKGAGVAIPVFSLRSKNSFGVGEFNDLKLLVDWAKKTGLKLVQILPVNDTTATGSWTDSYPYAGISAFALHPLYINLETVAGKKNTDKIKSFKKKQKQLNELADVDYEQVMKLKTKALKELYHLLYEECFESEDYKKFHARNKHWLIPYAAFCYLRDKYDTPDFQLWQSDAVYNKADIAKLFSAKSKNAKEITFHFFVQYHLHLQLKEAADYAHKNHIVLKGDIPIGIYRYSCDAWVNPDLFNMDEQAGAPPDDFAVKGQNWGFPTYNWKKMHQDDFAWWHQRFGQMSNYFDAFRIDHILGFFRIWSIPMHAIEGIMGHFFPAIPVYRKEFDERNIRFDYHRYCKPFITDDILSQVFGEHSQRVKLQFVIPNDFGGYDIELAFQTQRQVEDYFITLEQNNENSFIKQGLFDLISNVILFDADLQGDEFHFRIAMEQTFSFKWLDDETRYKLKELYVNYFYRRQDDFWKKEALHKLPQLKSSTNMLICGEDLGMVPHCVSEVMNQLGILSLEIQRMPKNPMTEFFHPNQAPYLSVVTPSTHDMSTIRGWWQEDHGRTQRFYNYILGQAGEAPYYCEAWINRAVLLQHLYSPAIWSIFQLQDILGISEKIRRPDPEKERINIPAVPKYYWRYRMHLLLEDLLKQKEFNEELHDYVIQSGRA